MQKRRVWLWVLLGVAAFLGLGLIALLAFLVFMEIPWSQLEQ